MKFTSKYAVLILFFLTSLALAQEPSSLQNNSYIQSLNTEKEKLSLIMVVSTNDTENEEAKKMFDEMKKNVKIMNCIEVPRVVAIQKGLISPKDGTLFAFFDNENTQVSQSTNIKNIDDLRNLIGAGG